MPDLLDKLNVLVRSRVNGMLSGSPTLGEGTRRSGRDPKSLDDAEKEIVSLRKHIDDALNTEDAMQRKVDEANAQLAALDQQADDALLQNDDTRAKTLVQQLQRQRRHATTLADDLENHRRATSELTEQVNRLESLVSDARSAQPDLPAVDAAPKEAVDAETTVVIQRASDLAAPQVPPVPSVPSAPPTPQKPPSGTIPVRVIPTPEEQATTDDKIKTEVDQAKVDDDLARRRARLSKPDGT